MTIITFNFQLKTIVYAQENGIENIPSLFARWKEKSRAFSEG